VAQYEATLELDPTFVPAQYGLAQVLVHRGQIAAGIALLEKLSGGSYLGELGYAYAVAAQATKARAVLGQLDELAKETNVSPSQKAAIHVGLHQHDQAFELLDQAFDNRDTILAYLQVEPWFDGIRSDPRFDALVRRMRFPGRSS
jgi:tetratricopeptide (TPR) repeat protein